MSKFTSEEKRNYMFRKHIRNHLFEYVMDIIVMIILSVVFMTVSGAENIGAGVICAVLLGIARVFVQLNNYKKEYIELIK